MMLEKVQNQLSFTMDFFPRVDAKVSGLFAINSAMLGTAAIRFSGTLQELNWQAFFLVSFLGLISVSFIQLYFCGFPHLKSPNSSLIFFGEISKKECADYVDEFKSVEDEALIDDILIQIWRNSEILSKKFNALKKSFVLTSVALLPWSFYIATAPWP